jgi:uncharacterized protein (DUF58 family)
MKTSAAVPTFLRLFRHRIPAGREVTLARQRIYLLPTRHGLLFAAMLAVMLLGATNYNNSLAFLLTFLLAALGLISILYTYSNLAGLQVRSGQAASVFAGQEAAFVIHLHNPDRQARYALQVASAGGSAAGTDVGGGGNAAVTLYLPARRRGHLPLGRVTLSTTWPLGLVRAWSYVDPEMHCLVYPQPGPLRVLREVSPAAAGERHGGAASDDFSGFRDYRAGDPLRHVHWKALARALPLMTKEFQGGEAPERWLDWENLPPLDVENRLRRLCRLVLEAASDERAYGLRLPGTVIAPDRGAGHRRRCLEALALFEGPRS